MKEKYKKILQIIDEEFSYTLLPNWADSLVPFFEIIDSILDQHSDGIAELRDIATAAEEFFWFNMGALYLPGVLFRNLGDLRGTEEGDEVISIIASSIKSITSLYKDLPAGILLKDNLIRWANQNASKKYYRKKGAYGDAMFCYMINNWNQNLKNNPFQKKLNQFFIRLESEDRYSNNITFNYFLKKIREEIVEELNKFALLLNDILVGGKSRLGPNDVINFFDSFFEGCKLLKPPFDELAEIETENDSDFLFPDSNEDPDSGLEDDSSSSTIASNALNQSLKALGKVKGGQQCAVAILDIYLKNYLPSTIFDLTYLYVSDDVKLKASQEKELEELGKLVHSDWMALMDTINPGTDQGSVMRNIKTFRRFINENQRKGLILLKGIQEQLNSYNWDGNFIRNVYKTYIIDIEPGCLDSDIVETEECLETALNEVQRYIKLDFEANNPLDSDDSDTTEAILEGDEDYSESDEESLTYTEEALSSLKAAIEIIQELKSGYELLPELMDVYLRSYAPTVLFVIEDSGLYSLPSDTSQRSTLEELRISAHTDWQSLIDTITPNSSEANISRNLETFAGFISESLNKGLAILRECQIESGDHPVNGDELVGEVVGVSPEALDSIRETGYRIDDSAVHSRILDVLGQHLNIELKSTDVTEEPPEIDDNDEYWDPDKKPNHPLQTSLKEESLEGAEDLKTIGDRDSTLPSDFGTWLKDIGLGQFVEVFTEEAIDFETLSELDESDLEDMGLKKGHRIKLKKAMEKIK